MKITLNKAQRKALLQAVANGYIDTEDNSDLIDKLQDGKNTFLELMKQLDAENENF